MIIPSSCASRRPPVRTGRGLEVPFRSRLDVQLVLMKKCWLDPSFPVELHLARIGIHEQIIQNNHNLRDVALPPRTRGMDEPG